MFTLYQPYLPNIRAYEPMYFLVGTRPRKSKFQFSFQYQLLNAEGPLAQRYPWVNGLHLAYTQTSLWDLQSDSKPFEDTSYKPELFFLSRNLQPRGESRLRVFVQGGVQHESNGLGGEFSRSTNVVYVKPILIWLWPDTIEGRLLICEIRDWMGKDGRGWEKMTVGRGLQGNFGVEDRVELVSARFGDLGGLDN